MARKPAIMRRLDAAIDKMCAKGMEIRAIYLTEKDWAQFDKALSRAWGGPAFGFSYRDHHIRKGERSRIFSKQGVGLAVPKRPPCES